MLKTIFLLFIALSFVDIAFAQKRFNLTVKLDSTINPEKIHYQYNDGENLTLLPDTFGDKRTIVLERDYYSQMAIITISYIDSTKKSYATDFFLNDKPAVIVLHFKANDNNELGYTQFKNAVPIYDSTANKSWGKLQKFMIDTVMAKENMALDLFLKQNNGFGNNDSVRRVFNRFYKRHMNRAMLYLKRYPEDYFSFWYFIDQVAQPNGILKQDTAYLKEQLAFFKAVFPVRYTGSVEGKELIKAFATAINPPPPALKLNEDVPPFSITTIDGKKISLNDLKGKYVLLDFWATWCQPCLAKIPFVKEIRKNYPADKLVIIGISSDIDSKKLNAFVKQKEMNWLHFYDLHSVLGKLYGIDGIPLLVLINKEGKMIYQSDANRNDEQNLPKVLNSLN